MSKIAIATMAGGANYGNALQNYAVLKIIEKYGFTAETLNITTKNGFPDSIPDNVSFWHKMSPGYVTNWVHTRLQSLYGAKNDSDFSCSSIKNLKLELPNWHNAVEKKKKVFSIFQRDVLKYTDFEVSNRDFNIDKLGQYSAFVTGSDQVWNPYYKTNSMVEFLQIAPKEKRIALAPSFGVSTIPDCRKQEYSQWLNEIPYLSVREKDGAKIIKELTGRDAKVLLDPTFGLTKDEWSEFAKCPKGCTMQPNSYVFCYFLGNRKKSYTKFINRYAKQHGCAIVDVFDVTQLEHYAYSPQEFVWLLLNAKAVFTDSFHGCAFSINLQKPFVVFDRAGDGCISQSSRITTVLNKTNLQNRKFEKRKFEKISIADIDNIQFENAIKSVAKEREEMLSYFKESLDSSISADCSINLATKRHCTGCGACQNICSQGAITMKADGEGFLYPLIAYDKCIECHACEKVCPADSNKPSNEDTKAFYAFSNNIDTCKNSSSGGIFTELAENVIAASGIVFGVGYNEDFKVCHISAETSEELANLRTSKYVQSDAQNVYSNVLEQLKTGRKVMYSGTPCQVAALKSYLKKDYENLLMVDIICHGVPSPGIWEDYLKQEHGDKKIKSISFRNKDIGWNNFSMKVDYKDGSFYRELAVKDPFERAFLANLTLRPSCYECQYKTVERVSDITIADYWGVETVHPELKEQQGVSLVLVHNNRGTKLFNSLENITTSETDLERAVGMNSACTHSVPWPKRRNEFFDIQQKMGVRKATEHCLQLTVKQKVKRFIVINGARIKKILRMMGVIR